VELLKRHVGVFLLAAALPAWVAAVDFQEGPPPASPAPAPQDDGRRTLRAFPKNLGLGVIGVFHADNLTPLLIGATATGASTYLDDQAQDALGTHDWGESLETGAGPIWSSVFVVSMFTAGRFAHGQRFRAMTYDMLDAVIVNLGYTELIKVAVGRERPNGENNLSFPSGHTSNSFALAAVAERHYGWKVGVPAYALASVVGASRIQQDKHFLSDVVGGATLGYIVGRTVVRVNGRPQDASSRGTAIEIAPLWAGGTRGVRLTVVF
jgi:membrane-associated phospholipid phosphatase